MDPDRADTEIWKLRYDLIAEEVEETRLAIRNLLDIQGFKSVTDGTTQRVPPLEANSSVSEQAALVEIVDGLIDTLFVVYGSLDSMNVDADAAFDRVYQSNMSKLDADGNVLRREDGKVLKSDLFQSPVLGDLI